jgi:small-conductance mechanosensitive channel
LISDGLQTTSFLGSSLWQWATAAGIVLAAFLSLLLVRRLIVRRLGRIAGRTATGLDDIAVQVARRTRTLLVLVPALWLGSLELDLPPAVDRVMRGAAALAVFLQVALWASVAIDLWVERAQRRRLEEDASSVALAGVLRFVGKLALWTILLLAALDNLGINVTALVTGLGIGGVAVALALQNVLSDLFASLAIIFDKPFVLGDSISVGDVTGTVENVGLKTTRLRSASGEQVILANGELLKSRIRNWKRMSERRVVLAFGVPYQTPADTVERIPGIVRRLVEAQDLTRFDRAHFKGFGPSSLDFEAVYWILTPDYNTFMDRQQAVNLGLLRELEALGIAFADPAQALLLARAPGPSSRNLPPERP